MYSKALILLAIAGITLAATPVRQCDGKPAPKEVRVKGCTKLPCPVYRGSVAEMDIDFVPGTSAKDVTLKIYATALGLTTEYSLDEDTKNACNHLTQGKCPLTPGSQTTHHITFPVLSIYPPIPVSLEIFEENEKQEVLSCFHLEIVVR